MKTADPIEPVSPAPASAAEGKTAGKGATATPKSTVKAEAGKATVHPLTTQSLEETVRKALSGPTGRAEAAAEEPGDDPETEAETGQEPSPENAETEGEAPEEAPAEEPEGEEEEPEESEARKSWPEKAVKTVSRLRGERRELRTQVEALNGQLTERTERISQLETELAAKPTAAAAATAGDPLAFIQTTEQANEFAEGARTRIQLFDDFLDGDLDEATAAAVTDFAKRHGGLGEDGEVKPGFIRREKRRAEEALNRELPKRLDHLRAEAQHSRQAEDVFPALKDKNSQLYADVQQVVKTMPELKRLPHWKSAAAIYALGLDSYRKQLAAKPGAKAAAAPTAAKPPAPAKLPGKARNLPQREAGSAGENLAALRAKAFGPNGTKEDVEAYTRASLRG